MSKENLKLLIPEYSQAKDDEKLIKGNLTKLGDQIKEILQANSLEEFEYGGLKISYKSSEKSSINEEKLIGVIKKLARKTKDSDKKLRIRDCIVKVEAIDERQLETLMYDGTVTPEDIAECYESKITWTLRLGKATKK